MKEECQKYGPVVSLLVPKENPGRGQVGALRFQSCPGLLPAPGPSGAPRNVAAGGEVFIVDVLSSFHFFPGVL